MRRSLIPAAVVLLAVALMAPAPAGAALQKAIWGPVDAFATYQDLGVNVYEIQLRWSDAAPRQPANPRDLHDPAYNWPSEIDTAISQAAAHGMSVAVMVIGAPQWANGGHPFNFAPRRPRDYADFVYAAAHRYPSVHQWMIWGEPSNATNFQPMTPAQPGHPLTRQQARAPHLYARMLDLAYSALKRTSSANLVIGGMTYTTGQIDTEQWITNLRLRNGRRPRLDLYGHNPFSFRRPDLSNPPSPDGEVDFSDLGRLSKLVDAKLGRRHHRHIPLFLSEWTVPTGPDSEFNVHVDLQTQAQWITSAFQIARSSSFIDALGWVHLADDPTTGTMGGLLDAQGNPKPGYAAFKAG